MSDPWEEYAKAYQVHEESRAFTNILVVNGLRPFHQYTLQESRLTWPKAVAAVAGEVKFDGTTQELTVPSPFSTEGIPVSVYKPANCVTKPAIVVYFHGGGLSILNKAAFEPSLKLVAAKARCIIVNVEYRLIQDGGEPHAPFNDADTATKWVLSHKDAVGGHPDSNVGVAGDSSGGQIAASVANDVSGVAFQILIYANVDMSLNTPSVEEFANVPGLSKADIYWFNDIIKETFTDFVNDPRVNPLARTKLGHSPPALILQAQLDTIRDSGLVYGEKLRAAGVKVTTVIIDGVPHCFFCMPGIFKTKCQEANEHFANFVSKFQ